MDNVDGNRDVFCYNGVDTEVYKNYDGTNSNGLNTQRQTKGVHWSSYVVFKGNIVQTYDVEEVSLTGQNKEQGERQVMNCQRYPSDILRNDVLHRLVNEGMV